MASGDIVLAETKTQTPALMFGEIRPAETFGCRTAGKPSFGLLPLRAEFFVPERAYYGSPFIRVRTHTV